MNRIKEKILGVPRMYYLMTAFTVVTIYNKLSVETASDFSLERSLFSLQGAAGLSNTTIADNKTIGNDSLGNQTNKNSTEDIDNYYHGPRQLFGFSALLAVGLAYFSHWYMYRITH
jgi:hypothetical protein